MKTALVCLTLLLTPLAALAQRIADTSLDRSYIGLAFNQPAPTGQIYPWDSGRLDRFLADKYAELDGLVTDPAIRTLATDLTLRDRGEGTSYDRQSTYDAFTLLDAATTQQDYDNALFVFLSMAQHNDPFAFERIEAYVEDGLLDLPPDVRLRDVTRKAADLDLLPAIERLTFYMMYDDDPAPPDVTEAYLRYAMDIAGEYGFSPIVEKVLDFYVHFHNDRASDGYALRALEIYAQSQSPSVIEDYRSFMYRYGVDLPQDEKLQVDAAIRSVALGDPRLIRTIGYMIMNGYGANADLDLGRDINLDGYRNGDVRCLVNLANIYGRDTDTHENLPLAVALYKYAVELDPSLDAIHGTYIADMNDYFYARERRVSDLYLAQLRSGDFSDIPHLGDAHPVDYNALLAQRESQ